jgi:hypothetical protein
MITFQSSLIIFICIVVLIIVFRYIHEGEWYFTSHYTLQKEYTVEETILKQNILSALEKANFKKIKDDTNLFTAITLPTIFSFSERIKTEISKVNESKYSVKFSSVCFLPTQIFDWGKNERNSNRFFKNLEASF